jgi:peptide/nickel transport system substrate-binding protein
MAAEGRYWKRFGRSSRRRFLRASGLGAAGLTAAALLACGGDDEGDSDATSQGAAGTPKDGGVFERVSGPISGAFPDMQKSSTFISEGPTVAQWAYNGIVRWDLKGATEPDLANLPEVANNGLKLTFTFKEGIKWHQRPPLNGREFTSEDAKKTIERIQNPATAAVRRSNYVVIDSMDTPDKKTLVMNLKEPNAPLLLNLGLYDFMMPLEQATGAIPLKVAADVIGTGAYTLETYEPTVGLTMKKRVDGYWKPGKAHIDEYRLTAVGDDRQNQTNALLAGRADFGLPNPEAFPSFEKDSRFTTGKVINDNKTAVVMNVQKSPYKDARVRQAISLAIDRRNIIQNRYGGYALMSGPIAPALAFWVLPDNELETLPGFRKTDPDLTESKALLSAAGLASGFDDTIIHVTTNSLTADLVIPMLAKVGIKLQSKSLGPTLPPIITAFTEGDFTIAEAAFTSGFEPDAQTALFHETNASRNYSKYSDPELDRMFVAARKEFNVDKRKQMYLDIQRYMLKGMATNFAWHNVDLPLYTHRTYVKSSLANASHQYFGAFLAEDMYLDGKT